MYVYACNRFSTAPGGQNRERKMPVFTLQTTIFCRGIVSSNGEGAHRCHSAVSSFIVPDLQSVNVTAALLRSPCQIVPGPQRAAPAASSYTFPLSVKSNAPFDDSGKRETSPRRLRPERIGSDRFCASVGRVCKPPHPCHLFHSEGGARGQKYANVTLSRVSSLTVTHPD